MTPKMYFAEDFSMSGLYHMPIFYWLVCLRHIDSNWVKQMLLLTESGFNSTWYILMGSLQEKENLLIEEGDEGFREGKHVSTTMFL